MIKKRLKKIFSVLVLISIFASYVPVAYAESGDLTVVSTSGLLSVRHPNLLNNRWVGAGTFGAKIEPDTQTIHKVYCVDLQHYLETNVPHTPDSNINSPEIIWILHSYYPNTTEPSNLAANNQKAAAVQLALWYFSELAEGRELNILETETGTPLNVFNEARAIIEAAKNQSGTVTWTPGSITLEPQNSTGYIGEKHTVTATVLNQNGTAEGMDQYMVTFSVSGANSIPETLVPLDSNGQAVFSYIGANPGEDTMTAVVSYTTPIGLRWIYTPEHQKIIMANAVPNSLRTTSTSNTWNPAVSGYKYHDLNGDGDWDNGEPALENWEIKLIQDGQQIGTSQLTNIDGFYLFTDVTPGTYTVEEVLQRGWTQKEFPAEFEIAQGEGETDLNFGNYKKISITACKMEDKDGDTETTNDQSKVPGWEMTLFKGGKQLGESQKTDREGCYTWDDLEPGSYSVTEANPDNWTALGETTHNFGTVLSGSENTHTFYNFKNINVEVCKYVDENGDRSLDGDQFYTEEEGWKVYLNETEQTTIDGCTVFENVGPGNYEVTEGEKEGWVQTYPEENNYNFDTVSGENEIFNFGNFKPEPDADIDKSSDKEIYEVTEDVTFTVRVYNAGNIVVSGTVTDTLPTGMYFISSNPDAASVNDNNITWDATLAPNEELFIEVTVGLDNSLIDQEQLINSVVYKYADPVLNETKTVEANDDILVIVPEEPNGEVLGAVVKPKAEGTVLAATGQPADIMILIGMMLIMPGLAIMLKDRKR